MTYRSGRWGGVLVLPILLGLLAGCVERRMVITTEPFGAVVYDERGLPLSASPADRDFIYYGKYRYTLVKDGYETLVVEEDVRAPWYEWFPFDFVSENLVPWTIRDVRRFHYVLTPLQVVPPEQVLEQGNPLRARGQLLGEPPPPRTPPILAPATPGLQPPQGATVGGS
jgi:hypothetical protein